MNADFLVGLAIGIFVGAAFGMLAMALLVAASDADERIERIEAVRRDE